MFFFGKFRAAKCSWNVFILHEIFVRGKNYGRNYARHCPKFSHVKVLPQLILCMLDITFGLRHSFVNKFLQEIPIIIIIISCFKISIFKIS